MNRVSALSASEISHIARLAKLDLGAEELESLGQDLSRVLEYIAVLDEVRLDSEGPVSPAVTEPREDVVEEGLEVEIFLRNAPKSLDRFLLVPAIK